MTRQIKSCLAALSVLLLSWLPASAFAQSQSIPADKAFGSFMANVTGANQQTVNFGSNGQAVLSTASGNLQAQASGTVQVGGRPLPVTATARPDMAKIASGVLKYASAISGPILLGTALYDLFQYVGGYFVDHNPDGTLNVTKPVGTQYLGVEGWEWQSTAPLACGQYQTYIQTVRGPNYSNFSSSLSGLTCTVSYVYIYTGASSSSTRTLLTRTSTDIVPSSEQELANAIANESGWPSTNVLTKAVAEAAPHIEPAVFQEQKTLTGPATLQGTTTTTVNVDNSTTTKTQVHNITYEGNNITVSTVTTSTTVMPDGTTKTETSTETNKVEPVTIETCGLPGKPVCNVKVDETGVKADPDLQSQIKIDDGFQSIRDVMSDPISAFPAFPALNFAFTLPTGCAAVSIPAFAPYLDNIDLCPFVGMFHDLMSIVWVMGGIFGAMSMFFRNTLATN